MNTAEIFKNRIRIGLPAAATVTEFYIEILHLLEHDFALHIRAIPNAQDAKMIIPIFKDDSFLIIAHPDIAPGRTFAVIDGTLEELAEHDPKLLALLLAKLASK